MFTTIDLIKTKRQYYGIQVCKEGESFQDLPFEFEEGEYDFDAPFHVCFSHLSVVIYRNRVNGEDQPTPFKVRFYNNLRDVCEKEGEDFDHIFNQFLNLVIYPVKEFQCVELMSVGKQVVDIKGVVDNYVKGLSVLTPWRFITECPYMPIYFDKLIRLGIDPCIAFPLSWGMDVRTHIVHDLYENSEHAPWGYKSSFYKYRDTQDEQMPEGFSEKYNYRHAIKKNWESCKSVYQCFGNVNITYNEKLINQAIKRELNGKARRAA